MDNPGNRIVVGPPSIAGTGALKKRMENKTKRVGIS